MIKKAFSEDDLALIAKYALTGVGLGGGAALATSLIDYIRNMNREAKQDPSNDDNTLYIRLKNNKGLNKKAEWDDDPERNLLISGPAAITSAAVSALGGWALVKALYKKMMLADAQRELDEAQNQFIDVSGYERTKKASVERTKDMSLPSKIISTILSIPGLFSIASGVVAYNTLNKYFPEKTNKKVTSPKKIKIVSDDRTAGEELGPDYNYSQFNKSAGVSETDGVELVIRALTSTNLENSDIANMVGDVAESGSNSFEKLASVIGFSNSIEATKGRASVERDSLREQLAITHLAKSASIGPQVAVAAAAEFAETFPSTYMNASALPNDIKDVMEKIACVAGKAIRILTISDSLNLSEDITKQANMLVDDNEVLSMLDQLNSLQGDMDNKDEDHTETSKEEAGIKKNKPKYVASSKTGLRLAKAIEEMDDIDKILNPDSNHR